MIDSVTVTPIAQNLAAPVAASSGVNVSTTTIVTSILGALMSSFVTVGAPLLSAISGTTTGHYIAGGLAGLIGLGSTVSSVWNLISTNKAASNNTINTINNLTTIASQGLAIMQNAQQPISPPATNAPVAA